MIRDLDGNIYWPFGDLQDEVSKLETGTYLWTGILEEPKNSMPGLVPTHIGVFENLRWEIIE